MAEGPYFSHFWSNINVAFPIFLTIQGSNLDGQNHKPRNNFACEEEMYQ